MSQTDLSTIADKYRENKRKIEVLEKENDALRKLMIDELDNACQDTIIVGSNKISYILVTSSRLDGKRLKADNPDLAALYMTESTSTRFTVV